MKKNGLYLIIFLALAGLTYFLFFRDSGSVFDQAEANFTVKDTAAITALHLSNPQGQEIKLSRNAEGWALNDSMVARQDAVDFLMQALHDQKPDQPVSVSYHDAVVRDMSANNTKIEVYQGAKKSHTFYVGRNPGTNNCTYMLTEGAKRPYVVNLPLQHTFLGVRYFCSISDWRERRILHGRQPITRIRVQYADSAQYSFVLQVKDGENKIEGQPEIKAPLNQNRVAQYLGLWEKIYCTGFENGNRLKDSILRGGRQLATINVTRENGKEESLVLFFRPIDKGTKATLRLDGQDYDFDSFFGWLNGRDFLLISRKNAEKMLRAYPEFFQP